MNLKEQLEEIKSKFPQNMQKNLLPLPSKKVEIEYSDLMQYGEYFGIVVTLENGFVFSLRMEEHQMNHLLNLTN